MENFYIKKIRNHYNLLMPRSHISIGKQFNVRLSLCITYLQISHILVHVHTHIREIRCIYMHQRATLNAHPRNPIDISHFRHHQRTVDTYCTLPSNITSGYRFSQQSVQHSIAMSQPFYYLAVKKLRN